MFSGSSAPQKKYVWWSAPQIYYNYNVVMWYVSSIYTIAVLVHKKIDSFITFVTFSNNFFYSKDFLSKNYFIKYIRNNNVLLYRQTIHPFFFLSWQGIIISLTNLCSFSCITENNYGNQMETNGIDHSEVVRY